MLLASEWSFSSCKIICGYQHHVGSLFEDVMFKDIDTSGVALDLAIFQVPGCQVSENFNFDCKARKNVEIRLNSLPIFEAAAELYTYCAYPDQIDATNRENYRIALSRWAVLSRAKVDKEWKESTEMERSIRPLIFSQSEKVFEREFDRGQELWTSRANCASMMLLPQFAWDQFGEFPPNVKNIALSVGRSLGYSEGSVKTVESRIWAPIKPAAHLATAIMLFFAIWPHVRQVWAKKYPLCYQSPFLSTLFYEDIVRFILKSAEVLEHQLPRCTRFRIREDELIRFFAIPRPDPEGDMFAADTSDAILAGPGAPDWTGPTATRTIRSGLGSVKRTRWDQD
jgi:hypothetical protein